MQLTKDYSNEILPSKLEEATNFIKNEMMAAAQSFISIGFYLKYIRDNHLEQEKGYLDIWDYGKSEFNLSKSTISRYIAINDRFSENGNSTKLSVKYDGYSYSKLSEMLTMTEEQLEQISPETTVAEIRSIKAADKEDTEENENIPGQMEITEVLEKSESDIHEPEEWNMGIYDNTTTYGYTIQGIIQSLFDIMYSEKLFVQDIRGCICEMLGRKYTATISSNREYIEFVSNEDLNKKFKVKCTRIGLEYKSYKEFKEEEQLSHVRAIATEILEDIYEESEGKALSTDETVDFIHMIYDSGSINYRFNCEFKDVETATDKLQVWNIDVKSGQRSTILFETDFINLALAVKELLEINNEIAKLVNINNPKDRYVNPKDYEKELQEIRNINVNYQNKKYWITFETYTYHISDGNTDLFNNVGYLHLTNILSEMTEQFLDNNNSVATSQQDIEKVEAEIVLEESNYTYIPESARDSVIDDIQYNGCVGLDEDGELYACPPKRKPCDDNCKWKPTGQTADEKRAICNECWIKYVREVLKRDRENSIEVAGSNIANTDNGIIVNNNTIEIQEELPKLKNNEQRKAWIEKFESWPLWIDNKQTRERFYRYEFVNGDYFVIRVACSTRGYWDYKERKQVKKPRWGYQKEYIVKKGSELTLADSETNVSLMVEYLKHLQKKEKEAADE